MLVKSENAVTTVMGEELAIFNADTGDYFVLNEVGKAIWESLEHAADIEDMTLKLTQIYDVDFETCSEHVNGFVTKLIHEKLLFKA